MKISIYGYTVEVSDMQIRKNFTLKELANNSGDKTLPMFVIDKYSDEFLDMLQEFRQWYAKPMTINSCYRQEKFNSSVGGDSRSAHLHACAVDWWIPNHTTSQRTNVQNKWASICLSHHVIGAINFYKNGYHLEAFSDKWYNQKSFAVRDYRNTQQDW